MSTQNNSQANAAIERKDAAYSFAERSVATKYEDLTAREVQITKQSILDTIGVILGGSTLGNKCLEFVNLAIEQGGKEESTILGFGKKVPAPMAGMANGAMAHTLDYDDATDVGSCHATAGTLCAALAVAEKIGGVSGKELITAIALGNDLYTRIGLAVPLAIPKQGWVGPMTHSVFGAALAASKLMHFDAEQTVNALGLAYVMCSGSAQVLIEGDSDIRENYQAFAVKNGILAALLTQRNIKGCSNCMEGKHGFFNLYFGGDYYPEHLDVHLHDKMNGADVLFKAYPACRVSHTYIDAARLLKSKYNIDPDDITEIDVKIGNIGKNLCTPFETRSNPKKIADAKFSIPYTVAASLVYGTVGLINFTPEHLRNPKVLSVASKVKWEQTEELMKYNGSHPAIVTVILKDGTQYTERVEIGTGDPVASPITVEDLVAKFKDCARYSATPITSEHIDMIVDKCMNLEAVEDVTEIIKLIG